MVDKEAEEEEDDSPDSEEPASEKPKPESKEPESKQSESKKVDSEPPAQVEPDKPAPKSVEWGLALAMMVILVGFLLLLIHFMRSARSAVM